MARAGHGGTPEAERHGISNPKDPQTSPARERYALLCDTLRDRICLLDYPPGTRLSEEALASEFGISRTPLRRVLGWLESQGLLVSVQGVGTIVTDVELEELAQVYQLRMELADLIGKLSPLPPDAETVALMRSLRQRGQKLAAEPDTRSFARLNIEFFHALMRCSGNAPLREISERLYYQTTRIWLKSISHLDLAEEVAIFADEINDVCTAVELGDIMAAASIRRAHISMSFWRLGQNGGGPAE
ncbi:GntR family transcriptional regulator [Defluviimonas sp. 20V17]|uniref:GntR family transcriptional regulator n=1 Tax=Allgaiera indica TaxID=765699 RepID=A0AAN5A076_9RHOB|nr:GntR family transcriptional regulator [Allgaiera indica]KDB01635.1 GntR family transcriptional regulator [Defluviimonas sp. 20V17]GHE03865.1 GntR family transcriptional regulator [Allgaiera indica]SDX36531.1 transcriptional regulator, GntR family [Allgaiera indica]